MTGNGRIGGATRLLAVLAVVAGAWLDLPQPAKAQQAPVAPVCMAHPAFNTSGAWIALIFVTPTSMSLAAERGYQEAPCGDSDAVAYRTQMCGLASQGSADDSSGIWQIFHATPQELCDWAPATTTN